MGWPMPPAPPMTTARKPSFSRNGCVTDILQLPGRKPGRSTTGL
jgi:hypothetical protein